MPDRQKGLTGPDANPWDRGPRPFSGPNEDPEGALEFYRRVFLEAPVAIVILTKDHLVADANVAAQQLLNRTLESLQGKPFVRVVVNDDRSAFLDIAQELTANSRKPRPLRLVNGSGTETEVAMIAALFKSEGRLSEFLMLVLIDRGANVSSDIL